MAESVATPTTATPPPGNQSSFEKPSVKKKTGKFSFAEIFKDEGMYHSVTNDAKLTLLLKKNQQAMAIKTADEEHEQAEVERELREIEQDARYNLGIFDRGAIRDIKQRNDAGPLPTPKVEQPPKKQEVAKLRLDKVRQRNRMSMLASVKSASTVVSEEALKKKAAEDRKFKELKTHMSQKVLGNIRSMNYANSGGF